MIRAIFVAILAASSVSAQTPAWQRTVVLPVDTTAPTDVREGIAYTGRPEVAAKMDVYRPKGARGQLPAVILVHGGPTSGIPVEARLMGQYTSLGKLIASRGLLAVTFTHRLTSANAVDMAAADVRQAVEYVVSHAVELGADPSRICVWAISAGGALVGPILRDFHDQLRCFVSYYNIFTPATFQDLVTRGEKIPQRTPPLSDLIARDSLLLPATLLVRAGKDDSRVNADIDGVVVAALRRGTDLELHAYAAGRHGFDVYDDTAESRDIIARTLSFLQQHLSRQ